MNESANKKPEIAITILHDGKWFIAFSPEYPEGNGQGLTEQEAVESLRQSILLLAEQDPPPLKPKRPDLLQDIQARDCS